MSGFNLTGDEFLFSRFMETLVGRSQNQQPVLLTLNRVSRMEIGAYLDRSTLQHGSLPTAGLRVPLGHSREQESGLHAPRRGPSS